MSRGSRLHSGHLALALGGDDAQAIYEALHAVDQPNDLPQVVVEALR